MSCRPRRVLLALLPGLLTPLGCANWSSCCPPMTVTSPVPAASAPVVSSELSAAQSARLCLTIARRLERKGYVVEAIQQYEKAREHDPRLQTVAHRLAVLYDLQGDAGNAEMEYQRALREQPGSAEVFNDLGYFHYRHGRMDQAEDALRRALALDPGCRCAWGNLGRVLAQLGRVEESYQAFTRVLRPAEAYSNLGVLLARQGRTIEARGLLRQAVALDPTLEQPRAFLSALPATPVETTLLPPRIRHGVSSSQTEIMRTEAQASSSEEPFSASISPLSGDAADGQGER